MKALDKEGLDYLANKVYDAINSGGSADYIVEEGTNGSWYYRKWASGIAECWCRVTQTVTAWQAWGNVWEGKPYPEFTFPSGLFNAIPSVIATVSQDSSGGVMYEMGQVTQSGIAYVIPIRPISTSMSLPYQYFVHARGLWKAFTPSTSKVTYPLGDYIIMREFTGDTLSMANNTGYNYFIPYTVPEGYKVLGTGTTRSNGNIALGYVGGWSDTQISIWCKHWSGSTLSCTFTTQMFFVKDV